MPSLAALADTGSRLDVGFWWFAGGVVVFLLVGLAIALCRAAADATVCGLCDRPLFDSEREWGLCTTHREQIVAYWEGK